MSSVFLVCPQSFTFCTDALLQCFPKFLCKNLSRWTAVLPWELTESQMIFIHIAIALHIPSLEITVSLCAIASMSLYALMSSKIQCWHLKYCHWHGWCVTEWVSEFSPQWWFFWGSLQIQALVMVILFFVSATLAMYFWGALLSFALQSWNCSSHCSCSQPCLVLQLPQKICAARWM